MSGVDMNGLPIIIPFCTIEELRDEVERLQARNDNLCKQLKQTRKWITKQERTLKNMAYQAGHVACTADDIEEWIGED